MIKLLDDLKLLEPIAKKNPYFGGIFTATATAVIDDPDLMSIWVECDEHKNPHTAINFKGETLQICTTKSLPGVETAMFMLKMIEDGNVQHIECDEATLAALKRFVSNIEVEKAMQMVLKKPIAIPEKDYDIRTEGNIDEVYEILGETFGVNESKSKDFWYLHMVRSVKRGQMTMFTLYEDNKAVSTAAIRGRTKNAGAITSVGTLPEYRKKGYASYLTALCANMLLAEGRVPYLVPANKEVQKMYEKLGFETEKPCYYIEIKNKED